MIVYDIPGRSIIAVNDDTIAKREHPQITGIKDATYDLARPTQLLNLIGPGFSQLSGEDATALPYRIAGGHVHFGDSECCAGLLAEMHNAFDQGISSGRWKSTRC